MSAFGMLFKATGLAESGVDGSEVERDRWGRPVIDGKAYTRVSTLADTLPDKGGLIRWAQRTVAEGMTPTMIRSLNVGLRTSAEVAEEAMSRAGSMDSATEGTVLHQALAEYFTSPDGFDWGQVDDRQAESILQAGRAVQEAGLDFVLAEQFVVGESWAGTFDGWFVDRHGGHVLVDIKTSAKANDVRFPLKVATQLAAYARARRWTPDRGFISTPTWSRLALLSVPLDKGTADLYDVDRQMADDALDLALAVRAIRSRTDLLRAVSQEGE